MSSDTLSSEIVYHSQPATAQDQWVIEKSGGKRRGYFIEIGSHDGVRHSNTLTLERYFGWTGILVEANANLWRQAIKNRPNCRNICCMIGPEHEKLEHFAIGGGPHGAAFSGILRFMSEEWRENHEQHGCEKMLVPATSLAVFLKENHAKKHIHYLSLDVEGAEYAILESYFNSPESACFVIHMLTVEFLYDRATLKKLQRLLEPRGYVLDQVRAWDACFLKI